MNRIMFFVALAILTGVVGCQNQSNTAEGPEGQKLTVSTLPKVTLTQSEKKEFSVAVKREKIDGPVTLSITDLPDGVTIVEDERTISEEKTELFLTLKADDNAKVIKEQKVKITAEMKGLKNKAVVYMPVEVTESLAHKKERKEKFVAEIEKRLKEVESQIKTAQQKVMDLKTAAQANINKEIGEAQEQLDLAKKKFAEVASASSLNWDQKEGEARNYIETVEKLTKRLLDTIEKAK